MYQYIDTSLDVCKSPVRLNHSADLKLGASLTNLYAFDYYKVMHSLMSKGKITEAVNSVRNQEGKHIIWLSEPEGQNYKIGLVVFINVLPDAEVHKASADVWRVLEGSGAFILGGELENGIEKKPNEWVAESIRGGERKEVAAGDVIDIPVGVPHQIDATGKFLAMLVVKIINP